MEHLSKTSQSNSTCDDFNPINLSDFDSNDAKISHLRQLSKSEIAEEIVKYVIFDQYKSLLLIPKIRPEFNPLNKHFADVYPLHLASRLNQPRIVKILIKLGYDPNSYDRDGKF
ncbi:hypothetical protein GJ496_009749 [Pomphorhynchus laevis]|nr:hypothetical protein GJ496_009749 [Pomphorhynchus laevis]